MTAGAKFKAHDKPVHRIAFSPDGKSLLSAGSDRTVRLWLLDTLKPIREWTGSLFHTTIDFSPDGRYVGIGGDAVRVWEIDADESAPPLIDSKAWADSCCFSPTGQVFAAFGSERAIMRWEIPSGSELPGGWGGTRASNNGHRFPTGGMAFLPDGKVIANCYGVLGQRGFDSVIHFWEASFGALLYTLDMPHRYAHPTKLVFSPDGQMLVAETGPILHVWDVAERKEITAIKVGSKHVKDFAFTPDGASLLVVHNESELRNWNTAIWHEAAPIDAGIGKLTAIAVSGDGRRTALGSVTGKVAIL